MSSLTADFDELMTRVRQGRELGHASFEPIYYLIFSPRQILEVKRSLPAWTAKLRNDGWDVHRFSIAEAIADIFDHAPAAEDLAGGRSQGAARLGEDQRIAGECAGQTGRCRSGCARCLRVCSGQTNAIVLVTDLEALHPYLRIGAIEGQLSGKFYVPTVFFYPGERTGKTRLKFLGFYPEDGNYRSVHVGG